MTMTLAKPLRHVAHEIASYDGLSFICHELAHLNGVRATVCKTLPAVRFLESLGMPLDGGGFSSWTKLNDIDDSRTDTLNPDALNPDALNPDERREVRATWCEFSAGIAKEWNVV